MNEEMSTDVEWEKWGLQDPYFGVITDPKFRKGEMTQQARQDFFSSGRIHVDHVLKACRKHIDPAFAPRRVLDFGCGVGRLVLPFAAVARDVVGVDISEAMLAEARHNCAKQGVQNAVFVKSDDTLSRVDGVFDLVHTAIVLQHIDAKRGTQLIAHLLTRLAPRGIGAIQVTYGKAYYSETLGVAPVQVAPPPPEPRLLVATKSMPLVRMLLGRPVTRKGVPTPSRSLPSKPSDAALEGDAPSKDPDMQMNSYDLNAVLFLMQTAGIEDLHAEFTDHGGELGVFLYFRKP
jgi:SAM-dependent methyltransferase